MIWSIFSGIFAVISVSACAWAWIQNYDLRLEQNKQTSHLQSLQSRIGNVKASARKEAREAAQSAVSEMQVQDSKGGGGFNMEQMLPMLLQMNGGGQQPQTQPRNNHDAEGEEEDPTLIGSGGSA